MKKLQPMSSPLGRNKSVSKTAESSTADNNEGLRKLPTGLGERQLYRRLPNGKINRRLTSDPLDSHLGEEREELDNKIDELKIPRHKDQRIGEESILDDLKIFVPPVIRDYTTLMSFMHNHVVELRFTRRHPKRGFNTSRKMLCTANWKFLSSVFTRWVFNWETPKSRRGVSWYKKRNLIIVWDLMSENFRMIPVSDIRFVSAYKCTSLMEKGRFIMFYRRNIRKLSPTQEAKYFNS